MLLWVQFVTNFSYLYYQNFVANRYCLLSRFWNKIFQWIMHINPKMSLLLPFVSSSLFITQEWVIFRKYLHDDYCFYLINNGLESKHLVILSFNSIILNPSLALPLHVLCTHTRVLSPSSNFQPIFYFCIWVWSYSD